MSDIVVIAILILILGSIAYLTRSKKKDGCSNCHSDCSSCSSFNFYDEYKKDHAKDAEETK